MCVSLYIYISLYGSLIFSALIHFFFHSIFKGILNYIFENETNWLLYKCMAFGDCDI